MLVNQNHGVDHLIPSNIMSENGWKTGVGKNWIVCDGTSVQIWKYHGSQRMNACFPEV